jgi:hypothetical protein
MIKNSLAILMLSLCLVGGFVASTGCTSTNGVKPLEEMTELEYSKWKLYIQLGVKIGANRLLEENLVSQNELTVAAGAIDALQDQPILGGATSLIIPALRNAGFNNDEVEFILLVAEQELLARCALEWLNPETHVFELSPRTKEVLDIIANALRSAGTVTPTEQSQASEMRADFCRQQ